MTLKEEFIGIVQVYSNQKGKAQELWNDIENLYSKKERFYHNLIHLENLFAALKPLEQQFSNWHTIVFAIVYHDAIYNIRKGNNEERSAVLAGEKLAKINFPEAQISRCKDIILATKSHSKLNAEADLFTDADLSILGLGDEAYKIYCEQIRNEYYPFPNSAYNPGRKKVLEHFLQMDSIFKIDTFAVLYESQARKNLKTEIAFLIAPYEELIEIVKLISTEIEKKKSDPFFSKSDFDEITVQLNSYIPALEQMEFWPAESLSNHFCAGSWLQDTAISSGWGDLFLELAKRFDKVYENLQYNPSPFEKQKVHVEASKTKQEEPKGALLKSFQWNWWSSPYKYTTSVDVHENQLYWWELEDAPYHDGVPYERWQTLEEFWKSGPLFGPIKDETEIDFQGPSKEEFYEFMEKLRK